MMLGMLCKIDRLLTELESTASVATGISAATDLFLYLRVFDHALQNAGAAHQNVVLLFVGHVVRGTGVFFGALKVSAIEVKVGGVEVNGADSVMVGALLVDGARGRQVIQRLAAKLS